MTSECVHVIWIHPSRLGDKVVTGEISCSFWHDWYKIAGADQIVVWFDMESGAM